MRKGEKICVLVYDIGDNKERARVAKIAEEQMVRVQKSVFEARLTQKEASALFERARKEVSENGALRLYIFPDTALPACLNDGGAPFPELHEFWVL
jgi:CRISPR-associated protein Cas2